MIPGTNDGEAPTEEALFRRNYSFRALLYGNESNMAGTQPHGYQGQPQTGYQQQQQPGYHGQQPSNHGQPQSGYHGQHHMGHNNNTVVQHNQVCGKL